jgi:hypothetical protein
VASSTGALMVSTKHKAVDE